MELFKNRHLHTKLGLALLIAVMTNIDAFCAQDAIVRSHKAVIYSDKEKTSPIGYIKRGRKIRVGEIPRAKGTVLPIVVSGRVCFIKITDLYLRSEVERYSKTVKYTDQDLMKKFQKK